MIVLIIFVFPWELDILYVCVCVCVCVFSKSKVMITTVYLASGGTKWGHTGLESNWFPSIITTHLPPSHFFINAEFFFWGGVYMWFLKCIFKLIGFIFSPILGFQKNCVERTEFPNTSCLPLSLSQHYFPYHQHLSLMWYICWNWLVTINILTEIHRLH